MVSELARLGIEVDYRSAKQAREELERLKKEGKETETQFNKTGTGTDRFNNKLNSLSGGAARAKSEMMLLKQVMAGLVIVGASLAASFGVRELIQVSDQYTRMSNQLKLVTKSTEELVQVQDRLFEISQSTYTQFESTVGLYQRMALSTSDMSISQERLLAITETVNQTLIVSGATTQQASNALLQFGQALAGGVLRAEEFNSIIENTPRLARALAEGTGRSLGEFRMAVLDGVVSAEELVEALEKAAGTIEGEFSGATRTIANRMTQLNNLIDQEANNIAGTLTNVLGSGLDLIIENFDGITTAAGFAFTAVSVFAALRFAGMIASLLKLQAALGIVFAFFSAGSMARVAGMVLMINRLKAAFVALFAVMAANPWLLVAGGIALATAAIITFGDDVDEETRRAKKALDDISEAGTRLGQEMPEDIAKAYDTTAIEKFIQFTEEALDNMNELEGSIPGNRYNAPTMSNFSLGSVNQNYSSEEARRTQAAQEEAKLKLDQFQAEREIGQALSSSYISAQRRQEAFEAARDAQYQILTGLNEEAALQIRAAALGEDELFIHQEMVKLQEKMPELREEELRPYAEKLLLLNKEIEGQRELDRIETKRARQQQQLLDLASGVEQEAELYNSDASDEEIRAQMELVELRERYDLVDQAIFDRVAESIAKNRELINIAEQERDLKQQSALLEAEVQTLRDFDGDVERYDIERRILELREEYKDVSEDIIRAEAKRQVQLENELEAREKIVELSRQVAEVGEDYALLPLEGLMTDIRNLYDDFWDNFVDKGFDSFDDLLDGIEDMFKNLLSNTLKQQFSGFLQSILGNVGGIGTPGIAGPLGGSSGPITGRAGAGTGLGGFAHNAQSFAQGAMPYLAAGYGGYQAGSALGGFLNPDANSTNQMVGAAIGTAIGAALGGPIGAAIGSFLGTLTGSLFGKSSDEASRRIVDLNTGQVIHQTNKHNNADNIAGANSLIDAVTDTTSILAELIGAEFTKQVGISVGSRDGIQVLRDANYGGGGANAFSRYNVAYQGEDAEAAFNEAIQIAIGGAVGGNETLLTLAKALASIDTPAEDLADTLETVKSVLEANDEPLSEWQQRLEDLNDQLLPVIDSVGEFSQAGRDLKMVLDESTQAISDDFNESIRRQILQFESPLAAQFEDLFEQQQRNIEDAIAVGGDLEQVNRLNELAFEAFLDQAIQTPGALEAISENFQGLIDKAYELGQATDQIEEAFEQVRQNLIETFDSSIEDQLLELQNPTLAAFNRLIEQEQERLDAATEIGANIVAVERLNALERQRFFESLSEDQITELGDFLGMIEDFSGRLAFVLSAIQGNFDKLIDDLEETKSNLLDQANEYLQISNNVGGTRQSIQDRFDPTSPNQRIQDLRGEFSRLQELALSGDVNAANRLPEVANLLIENSRQYFASSETFQQDYEAIIAGLAAVEQFTKSQSDTLFNEAENLESQLETLEDIREILASSDPSLEYLQSIIDQGMISGNILEGLLTEYVDLTNQQLEQQQITLQTLQANAIAQLTQPTSLSTPSPVTVEAAKENTDQVVNALDIVNATISGGLAQNAQTLEYLADEIRRDRIARAQENS